MNNKGKNLSPYLDLLVFIMVSMWIGKNAMIMRLHDAQHFHSSLYKSLQVASLLFCDKIIASVFPYNFNLGSYQEFIAFGQRLF